MACGLTWDEWKHHSRSAEHCWIDDRINSGKVQFFIVKVSLRRALHLPISPFPKPFIPNEFNMVFRLFDRLHAWSRAHRSMAIAFPTLEELATRKHASIGPTGAVIAFYTTNSFYEHEKDRLLASARYLGLKIISVAVENKGSWVRNAGLKPSVLVQQRKLVRGPLLYVDVDAVFHRDPWPALQSIESDIAVYYEKSGHLLSGTVLINDTPSALALLEAWQKGCMDAPEVWDQLVLEQIVMQDSAETSPRYSITRLPVSFCWIFDDLENEPVEQVYIEHLQASREAKKRRRFLGRIGKRLKRRRDRIVEIERILLSETDANCSEDFSMRDD